MVKKDIWRVGCKNYKVLEAVQKAHKDIKGLDLTQRQVIDAIKNNPNILKSEKIKRYLNEK